MPFGLGDEPSEDVRTGEAGVVVEEVQPLGRIARLVQRVGAGVATTWDADVPGQAHGERIGWHDLGRAAVADHHHPHVDAALGTKCRLRGCFLRRAIVHGQNDDVDARAGHGFLQAVGAGQGVGTGMPVRCLA
ncbi:hypothetical protein [Streptomyces halstedii]|uniref:hypothetical protein n=1 Tax=Streptomyces halstedii TaxID=1944 RepID=UPI0033BBF532